MAERFLGSLTQARPSHRDDATRQEAQDDIIDDIEMFSNRTRLHSYWGDVSPNDDEGFAKAASLRVRFSLTTTIIGSLTYQCAEGEPR